MGYLELLVVMDVVVEGEGAGGRDASDEGAAVNAAVGADGHSPLLPLWEVLVRTVQQDVDQWLPVPQLRILQKAPLRIMQY